METASPPELSDITFHFATPTNSPGLANRMGWTRVTDPNKNGAEAMRQKDKASGLAANQMQGKFAAISTKSRSSQSSSTTRQPASYGTPPPTYDDALNDLPPEYSFHPTTAEARAILRDGTPSNLPPKNGAETPYTRDKPSPSIIIDFECAPGIRQRVSKKQKKAAKKVAQEKWGGDDEDEDKTQDGNQDGTGGDGGGDGGNAGGDGGGDGGGGGGGDDWDDWATGGSKKKNKKKKKEEEEEEERKRQEEEEAAAAAKTTTTTNNLSWADEMNDANPDDEWAGFTSVGKKDKKKKKGTTDSAPASTEPPANSFQEINLDDGAPQLDLSFDAPANKTSGGGFSFGGWGKDWNTGGFGSLDANNSAAPAKGEGNQDDNPWSLNSGKKNKKKGTTFDLGDLGTPTTADISLGDTKEATAEAKQDDAWAGFTAVNKKDKKKKKGGVEELPKETDTAPAAAEPDPTDEWGVWSVKKDKKKKGKSDTDDTAAAPAAEPAPEPETAGDDVWAAWNTKDKKKKKGKGTEELLLSDPPQELDPPAPEPEKPTEADDIWTALATKKDKKKKKGFWEEDLVQEVDPVPDDPKPKETEGWNDWSMSTSKKDKKSKGSKSAAEIPAPDPDPVATDPDPVDDWLSAGAGKKKKGKKTAEEHPVVEEPSAPAPEPESEAIIDNVWAVPMSKKDKKKVAKKGLPKTEEEAVPEKYPNDDIWDAFESKDKKDTDKGADIEEDSTWGWATSIKKKDKKKDPVVEDPVQAVDPPAAAETAAADEDWFGGWGTASKKKDKSKKGLIDDLAPPSSQLPDPPVSLERHNFLADDTWNFSTEDKKKKKSAAAADLIEEVPPPAEPEPADDGWGIWGSAKSKDKKSKKEKVVEPEPEPEPAAPVEEKKDDFWAGWENWTSTERKKKEKEAKKKGIPPRAEAPPAVVEAVVVEEPEEPKEEPRNDFWAGWENWTSSERKKKEKEAKRKGIPPREEVPIAIPDPDPEPEPEPVVEKKDDFWAGWDSWSPIERRRKEKEATKKGLPPREEIPIATPEPEPVVEEKKDDFWAGWDSWSPIERRRKEKEATKKGLPPRAEIPIVTPEPEPVVEEKNDDFWAGWDSWSPIERRRKEKEAKKNGIPPREEAPVAIEPVLTEEPKVDFWAGWETMTTTERKKKEREAKKMGIPPREEVPMIETPVDQPVGVIEEPKDDFWAGWATMTSSERRKKEKEAKKKGIPPRPEGPAIEPVIEAPPPAPTPPAQGLTPEPDLEKTLNDDVWGAFSTKTSKITKKGTTSKTLKTEDSKLSKTRSKENDGSSVDATHPPNAKTPAEETPAKAVRGFWASFGTTSAPKTKSKEAPLLEDLLIDVGADAEAPDALLDGPAETAAPPLKATSKTTTKSAGKLSVSERIEALEKKRKEKEKEKEKEKSSREKDNKISKESPATVLPPPPPALKPAPEPAQESPQPPKKSASATKSKLTKSSSTKKAATKEPAPEPVKEKSSRESIPGSFPATVDDDEAAGVVAAEKGNPSKKTKKSTTLKKSSVNKPAPPSPDLGDHPDAVQTPSPEPAPKSVKKERTKVERTTGASSWGFWGAAPPPKKPVKKEVRSKDDSDSPRAKEERQGLSRSKSDATKRSKARESENETEKSSSDKDKRADTKRVSRGGMGFSNFILGGPAPPARTKSVRRSGTTASRPSSRRQSATVDDTGLLSPPPEDRPEVSDKAAKLMGIKPSKSKRESSGPKRRSVARDPYSLDDDDDIVMVNGDGGADVSEEPRRSKGKPKRTSKARQLEDDLVMVDAAEQSPRGVDVVSGPDDLAFVEPTGRERRPKKTIAPQKKAEGGGLRSLFGSLRKPTRPELQERRRSRSYRDEMTETDKEERRARREERHRRLVKPDTDGEGFATDAGPFGGTTGADDAEARRIERKARRRAAEEQAREAERREIEERRAKRERAREEREKRVREEEEREERRREEKRARRAARDERRAREEQEAKETREAEARAEARTAERRERRRTREAEEINGGISRHASKSERRRSYPAKSAEKRSDEDYPAERPHHRSGDERPRESRRKSTAPDPEEPSRGYGMIGKSKTSSWVNSQITDPPEVPPIVPTVLDVPPGAVENGNAHSLSSDEEARRRARRQARRRAKYPGVPDDEIDESHARRRESRRVDRDGIKSSSGSGDYERDRASRYRDDAHPPRPVNSKRASWFKKFTSL